MVSRPGSPTVANEMEGIQPTENNIEEPHLLRLKLSRRSHKGYMRRLSNQALVLIQNVDTTLAALTKLKQQITSKKEDLSKKDEIDALDSLEKLEEEVKETISFTEEIDNCIFELDKMVKGLSIAKDESTQQRRNADGNSILQQANTRLLKLEMSKFNGDVLSFSTCWELFDANFNSLTTLTSVQNFSYLKTILHHNNISSEIQLPEEPSTLIANLEMIEANYNSALEILKDRYGDKQRIIEAHYRKILNLDPKTDGYTHLKQIFDISELHIRGLEAQNKKKKEFGDATIFLMDKLSGDLRCSARDHRKATWTVDDFLTALKRELQVLEQNKTKEINSMTKLQPHSTAAFFTYQTQSSRTQHKTGYGTKDYTGPKKTAAQCSFCGSSYRASDCPNYINIIDRLGVAKRKAICFNCLKKHRDRSSFAAQCERGTCRKCSGKHHINLDKEDIGEKKKEDTAKTEEVQSNFTYANQSGIIKTFMATVANGNKTVKAAVLLDDRISDTFCTLNLAQTLQLPTKSHQRLSISHFGSEDKTDKCYNQSPSR